ncbi:hypothetical protein [Spongiibacter sp. UBA1325]|uniref:hypothetical protein n=1 Tax=Spongiibacter sp. UBA1325 TaxID=1947543 RepID=UPI00257BA8F1|nr:hypothetical protein [Spongiibacter sp. UBA1325]|tara:strand:+ start:8537 stop:8980 length:444 start_codon:yes stop_codon:yes gene_type:complete
MNRERAIVKVFIVSILLVFGGGAALYNQAMRLLSLHENGVVVRGTVVGLQSVKIGFPFNKHYLVQTEAGIISVPVLISKELEYDAKVTVLYDPRDHDNAIVGVKGNDLFSYFSKRKEAWNILFLTAFVALGLYGLSATISAITRARS